MKRQCVSNRFPLPNRPRPKASGFSDFDELEIARQLTVMEFELFRQIQPSECLNQSWLQAKAKAPNVSATIIISKNVEIF